MKHNEINKQLEYLLLRGNDKRRIKKVKLNSKDLIDVDLVDNLFAAKQFLVRQPMGKVETVVNYCQVQQIEIGPELIS